MLTLPPPFRRRHRDRVVRHGLGMIIESDFYATDAGRRHFGEQLTSIKYCVQETCNYDVLFAYLSSTNYDFRYDVSCPPPNRSLFAMRAPSRLRVGASFVRCTAAEEPAAEAQHPHRHAARDHDVLDRTGLRAAFKRESAMRQHNHDAATQSRVVRLHRKRALASTRPSRTASTACRDTESRPI